MMKSRKTTLNKEEILLFHQANAPCQNSISTIAKLHDLNFELLLYPSYSPDLAPIVSYLFAYLTKCSPERDMAPMKQKQAYFEGLDKSFYRKE